MHILETERLYLREMTIDDAENAYFLNLDPEVLRFTGDEPFESIEKARSFLENYDHYRKYGFGRWAMILKSTHEFIGFCGLKYTEEENEFDIGFRLLKNHWNKGYATEAAKACLDLGFSKFDMKEIVGRVMKENMASIRVLEKLGLRFHHSILIDGQEELIYKISHHS
ncbi:MAG: GNAT family N-acetyltransferase [Saprospiraceae bacterium]|nr:GNAT family N-acetyltransferase [Saprospiraceae bacterium]MBK9631327.1 GNAT family N-acetyltransferase [Saprospiraceae bacterium]